MEYTNRVKLCEDGLYRWYYDLDMRKDHYMLNVVFKVLGIIAAVMFVMLLLMPSGGMSKWQVAGITFGCFGVVVVIAAGIYLFMLLRGNGFYRYRYDMGPEGVMLWQEEADIRRNQVLGHIAAAAGAAAGHPVQGAVSDLTARTSAYSGYTKYKSVRRAVADRERNCIFLKLLVGENVVYVSGEDFDFVKDYIQDHLKEDIAFLR